MVIYKYGPGIRIQDPDLGRIEYFGFRLKRAIVLFGLVLLHRNPDPDSEPRAQLDSIIRVLV